VPATRLRLRLRLTLIGRVDAWSFTSQRVRPRTRKARALLAILVLAAPQPVARARIASLLWSRRGEEQARGSLRQALHELQ
jgi:DNA-binding SARP family transcriptional activator